MTLPMDAVERLPLALSHLDGWVESLLALLRYILFASSRDGADNQIPYIETCPCTYRSDRSCWIEMFESDS